jgi:hypothetical protein
MTNDKPYSAKSYAAQRRLATIAYHEAGHVVASHQFEFKIKQVTIVPTDYVIARVTPRSYVRLRSLEWDTSTGKRLDRYHNHIVILLAGPEAQRHFNLHTVRYYSSEERSDYHRVRELLYRLHGENKESSYAFKYLRERARNLVTNPLNWSLIEALANALLERQTLSADEVFEVFKERLDACTKGEVVTYYAGGKEIKIAL